MKYYKLNAFGKEWLENRAKRYDTIKEIVMYMVRSKRTWTDDDIYRLFLIDDKELEEIYELYTSINHYLSAADADWDYYHQVNC